MTRPKKQDSALEVGKRLLAFRKLHGFTQAEFAEELGIPKSTYVAWEREESEASARLFMAIHRVFGSDSLLALLGDEGQTGDHHIDWIDLGKIASKVDSARKKLNVYLDVEDIVEVAGSIYDRAPEDRDKALEEFRMYLKIQLKHLPRDRPPLRFSEAGKGRHTPRTSGQWHRGEPWEGIDPTQGDD